MSTQADQMNRYAAPQAEVEDAADEEHELAGRGTRLAAVILDGLILVLLVYTPILVGIGTSGLASIGVSGVQQGGGSKAVAQAMLGVLFGVAGIIAMSGFLFWVVLTIYFVKKNGQTIGKKMLGIKVVRTDGSRASLGRLFWLRNVVNALPSVIPFVGGIYNLVDALMIFSEPRRCIHDRIADTIVVKA